MCSCWAPAPLLFWVSWVRFLFHFTFTDSGWFLRYRFLPAGCLPLPAYHFTFHHHLGLCSACLSPFSVSLLPGCTSYLGLECLTGFLLPLSPAPCLSATLMHWVHAWVGAFHFSRCTSALRSACLLWVFLPACLPFLPPVLPLYPTKHIHSNVPFLNKYIILPVFIGFGYSMSAKYSSIYSLISNQPINVPIMWPISYSGLISYSANEIFIPVA